MADAHNERSRALVGDVRDIWDQNAQFWSDAIGDGNRFHRLLVAQTIERLLEVRPGQMVLDLACGHGHFSKRLVELGAFVIAADYSEQMLEIARRRLAAVADRVRFVNVDFTDAAQITSLGLAGVLDGIVASMSLMDIPEIEPMAAALPALLRPGGSFVISVLHPCFNNPSGCRLGAEEEDRAGALAMERYVRVTRYKTPVSAKVTGIIGQAQPHYYFHRSISDLMKPFLRVGWVVDGLEEPSFPSEAEEEKRALSWEHYPEIPPVLAARLRYKP